MRVLILVMVLALSWVGGAQAQQARQMLNGLRAEQGISGVVPSEILEEIAMAHAMDMAENGFFSHTGSDGSSIGDRARAAGYGYCAIAENIAKGQKSLTEVMSSWAASRGHRRNMLNRNVTEYGLVRAPGHIWVMVLGAQGC
jgi:uncharacterized protein YkwD